MKNNSMETNKGKDIFQERVVKLSRVSKVVKGGRRFSFSAFVVAGNGKGQVGFGLGKAGEVPDAIKKGAEHAKKNLFSFPVVDGTIPFEVVGCHGASSVVMYPAKKGKGIIAGGGVRIVVELAGILDIVCKIHGSKTAGNVIQATINGLEQLIDIESYAVARGKTSCYIKNF